MMTVRPRWNHLRMQGELVLDIEVVGKPEPQGSTQAYVPTHPKTKQPYRRAGGGIVVNVTSDNPALKAWRTEVELAVRDAVAGAVETGCGFTVELTSFVKRPEGDWGTGRNAHLLKDHADAYPIVRPDADKLLRAILDAVTGALWKDDSQVTDAITSKRFAVPDGDDPRLRARIRVWRNSIQKAEQLPMEDRVRVVPPARQDSDDDDSQLALQAA